MEFKKVMSLESELWHACAGPLVRLPPVNSMVYYFPQGHADHVDLPAVTSSAAAPNLIRCLVAAVKLSADIKTDDLIATMTLVPTPIGAGDGGDQEEEIRRAVWCTKVLTQSDANNGGGFSVPKLCADKIFPSLDFKKDPPVQEIIPVDIHGKEWRFRHIYRGTPRRHLLTTGWSKFVNGKKLVAGDSIIFLKSGDKGAKEVKIGVRRGVRRSPEEKVRARAAEAMAEAVALAVEGKPFEAVYYPCWKGGAAAFVVKEEEVMEAAAACLETKTLCAGARVTMEVEDDADPCLKKSWSGTVAELQAFDPIRWPTSPWKMVKVNWESEDKGKKMSQVNPWSLSVESNEVSFSHYSASATNSENSDKSISAENDEGAGGSSATSSERRAEAGAQEGVMQHVVEAPQIHHIAELNEPAGPAMEVVEEESPPCAVIVSFKLFGNIIGQRARQTDED